MNTIYITIENLIAALEVPTTIVSDNTGYQVYFDFDEAWDAYPAKTAVFAWTKESLNYSKTVAFEGNTVQVPRLPAISTLYVGVMAGDLQTTTAAEIPCQRSILSRGGQEPEPPTESEYAQLMQLISKTVGESAYEIAVNNGFEGTEEQWLQTLIGAQGQPGADGYTPVKGVDYFTEGDIAQVVGQVLAQLPVAEETVF